MPSPAVLIAAADLLPALKARLADEHELLAFADSDALRALEVITTRRPAVVLLEQRFAATPRGAALINRIKADPSLAETRVRIAPSDTGASSDPEPPPLPAAPMPVPVVVAAAPLDYRGTRRAPRFSVTEAPEIVVDGNRGTLVDIATLGAQMLTPSVLKPNQRVRVALTDTGGTFRCTAVVVWAAFEIPQGSTARYRVGLEFIDADATAVEAYARRHVPA